MKMLSVSFQQNIFVNWRIGVDKSFFLRDSSQEYIHFYFLIPNPLTIRDKAVLSPGNELLSHVDICTPHQVARLTGFAFIHTTMCQLLISLRDWVRSKTFTPLPLQPACNCYSYIPPRKRKGEPIELRLPEKYNYDVNFFSPESLTCYLPINTKSLCASSLYNYRIRETFPIIQKDEWRRCAGVWGTKCSPDRPPCIWFKNSLTHVNMRIEVLSISWPGNN